jgi:hypothetical protein
LPRPPPHAFPRYRTTARCTANSPSSASSSLIVLRRWITNEKASRASCVHEVCWSCTKAMESGAPKLVLATADWPRMDASPYLDGTHPCTRPRTFVQRCSTVVDSRKCSCGVAVAVFVQQSVSPGRKCTSTAQRKGANLPLTSSRLASALGLSEEPPPTTVGG